MEPCTPELASWVHLRPPFPHASTHQEGLQAGKDTIQPDHWSETSTVLEQRVEDSGEGMEGKRVTGLAAAT